MCAQEKKSPVFEEGMNPYHYIVQCIGGKWKMTILHEIYTFGEIRFNNTLREVPISEKVFAQQLREMVRDGLIRRISYDTVPPKTKYVLTPAGMRIMPALDMLYIWSVEQMYTHDIPIDKNNFVVHSADKYVDALGHIMTAVGYSPAGKDEEPVKRVIDKK